MGDERVNAAVELILEQIAEKEQEIARLRDTANAFCAALGAPLPFPDAVGSAGASTALRRDVVKPDQFVNFSAPSTAARAFLEWRKEKGAASADDIFDALQRGGFLFEQRDQNDAKNGLRIALGKDGAIIRLPNGFYGLAAWYPDARKERAKKKEQKPASTSAASAPSAEAKPNRLTSADDFLGAQNLTESES